MHNFSFLFVPSEPGTITFEKRGYLVKESCGEAEIAVLRQNGAGKLKWKAYWWHYFLKTTFLLF